MVVDLPFVSHSKEVSAKLGNMRKPQSFVVYPRQAGEPVHVQSDRACGWFDPATGKGMLNTKGSHSAHLLPALGARAYTFPNEFVCACLSVSGG